MFSWVCPRCGREVPPSKTECPSCAAPASGPEPTRVDEVQQTSAGPQTQPAPPVTHHAPTPTPWAPPEGHSGKPAWLIAVLAFGGVIAVFAIAYFVMGSHRSTAGKDVTAKQLTTNPLQKYIEVVGVRIVPGKGGQMVKFLVVNHAGVELTDLSATVT